MAERRLSAAAKRAIQMMLGGLVAGHLVGLCVLFLAGTIGGGGALLAAALGFVAVLLFFSIGQAIEVIACELDPVQGLALALASYGVRVTGIGGGMWLILTQGPVAAVAQPAWLAVAVVSTVLGWVTGVVLVGSRQRVQIYDVDYVAPPSVGKSD